MRRVVIPGFRKIETSGGGEGGTTNYNDLTNKPSINNVPLVGNLKTVDLKLTDTTLTEEGVPAEAKTVGTKLEEQSTSLTAVKEELTKKVNVSDIPTKVSELQNDSNYQTDTDVTTALTNYATKTYVGEQISSADHLKREIVTEIPSPETADKNTIYMLKIESATGNDKYREYLLIDGTVQCIGDTSVDLTDYAKKTEIPTELPANGGNSLTVNGHTVKSDVPENAVFTDTVYDDTEVKGSIDELNSNLTDLKFSDVAGGKNLVLNTVYGYIAIDKKINIDNESTSYIFYAQAGKTYSFSGDATPTAMGVRFAKVSSISPETQESVSDYNVIADGVFTFTTNETGYYMLYVYNTKTSGIKFQIEEGTKATPYEPYIPSVKMLADEVSTQNESLDALGKCKNLLNPTLQTTTLNGVTCTNNGDGTYTLNGTKTIDGAVLFILGTVSLKANKSYKLIGQSPVETSADVRVYDNDGIYFGNGTQGGVTPIITPTTDLTLSMQIRIAERTINNFTIKPMITTNLNATYDDFVPYTGDGDTLTHDVAEIKNDLDKLNSLPIGSIIQIEADKDNIETTTQKYGWQYLGTSNIEYENGATAILVTNVYRKNN